MDRNSSVPLNDGDKVKLECIALGEKGDGIFKTDSGYVVIVPETEVGKKYLIEIKKATPKVAFGEISQDLNS